MASSAAEAADRAEIPKGLTYCSDAHPGLKRVATRDGFEYFGADGSRVTDEKALDRIRGKIKGPPVHHVYLDDDFNASIRQVPRFGLFGGAVNSLSIGLPLLMMLDRRRLLSVLAHEYGHLRGNHGKLSAWIYRTISRQELPCSSIRCRPRTWPSILRRRAWSSCRRSDSIASLLPHPHRGGHSHSRLLCIPLSIPPGVYPPAVWSRAAEGRACRLSPGSRNPAGAGPPGPDWPVHPGPSGPGLS